MTSARPGRKTLWLAGLAALAFELAGDLAGTPSLASPRSPEQDTLETAKRLKPVSDDEWKTVAGARIAEKYQIIRGDTLFDVSKRLFGDGRYWPKLYALNNDSITNPHVIRPGREITFEPGTGTALPSVAVVPTATDATNAVEAGAAAAASPSPPAPKAAGARTATRTRSSEWQKLPRQDWENTVAMLPTTVDKHGIDLNSKVTVNKSQGFELEAVAATERVPFIGQIIGARSPGEYLGLGDTVYIRADEDVQVGETYAITQEPAVLKARKSDRIGLSYPILGRVKVIGVRDNLFIGTIMTARGFINRGSSIMLNPPRVPDLKPVAAPAAVEGVVILDKSFSTYATAQHKLVFVNRGSDDGVKPGMIFRAYEHFDPSNEKRITSADFIIDADMMVVQVSERFSLAIVTNSLMPVYENAPAVLLTDVSDLGRHRGLHEQDLGEAKRDDELDELDQLEGGAGLGQDEKKELEQLERWRGNPPPQASPTPDASPSPDGSPIPEASPPPEASPIPDVSPSPDASPPSLPSPEESAPTTPAPIPSEPEPTPTPMSTSSELPPPPPPASPPGGEGASSEDAGALDRMLNQ